MVETRWFRRAGPGIAAAGAIALIASTTLGAPARAWDPPDCAGQPSVATRGWAWFRIDPILADGTLVGQRLTVGRGGSDRTRFLDLAAESFASGPYDGRVLVGTDDGRRSTLRIVDVPGGCASPIGTSSDVIRHALLAPSGDAVYEHRVERATRRDLGVWRRSLDATMAPVRALGPIGRDGRFGPTWRTELSWTEAGTELVVQSCGEVACRFRVLDPRSGSVDTVADPQLGDAVVVDADHVVAYDACRGLPCPLVSVARRDGSRRVLAAEAGQATAVRDTTDGALVVFESEVDGGILRRSALDGSGAHDLPFAADGRRLVAGPARAAGAGERRTGWLLLSPDGRPSSGGPFGSILRRISDGQAVSTDEVP